MDNQRKLTKKLSIVGLILSVLSLIACAIFIWLCIMIFKYFYSFIVISIIFSVIFIAKFVILIIFTVKTTSRENLMFFIMAIILFGFWPFDFIGFILELRISRKSDVFSNQEIPQIPNNSNNTTNAPTY